MSKLLIEDIVHFQSIESFEESTGLDYDSLGDKELFEALSQYHYPGEHDNNWRDSKHINTNFLGYEYENDNNYLLARYEQGLTIGLSYVIKKGGK